MKLFHSKIEPELSIISPRSDPDSSDDYSSLKGMNYQNDVANELENIFAFPPIKDILFSDSVSGFTEFKLRQIGTSFLICFCFI